MSDSTPTEKDFLSQLTAIIEKNIANEQFGVSELADEMNMSRSNLLRKVKKETNLSVSQLISQVRLKRGMELLRTSSSNVSEVSHQVGFSSTSYFIKCFREYYGYPPGEVGKREDEELKQPIPAVLPVVTPNHRKRSTILVGLLVLVVVLAAVGVWRYDMSPVFKPEYLEKSIVVLPFKNDSNDSTNVYLINGLMESTLNNLQKIKDLKVISRTSAEKYRNTAKSIPEMAKELNVNYFVEGSGQKIGDRILLNIQLIDGTSDRHLWSKQYRREASDIFALQQEIAKDIASEIQAVITPEEEKRIDKIPTENLVAYDFYLKGSQLLYLGSDRLEEAIDFFAKAIEHDNKFALAYAKSAIAYFYQDAYKADKKYAEEIERYADKALLYDPKHAECLLAKAMVYMHRKEYELAVPYLEKALEYNPNSVWVIGFLSDFYANYLPNTAKYLEYSLQGVRLDIGSQDSINTSYTYLRLGNALIQTGFVDESLKYIDKSLEFNPKNPFSRYVRAFIVYAKHGNLNTTRQLLIEEFNKDTTRIDILQDIGKVSYHLRDYPGAYQYYKKFIVMRETRQLDVYRHENLTIGIVLAKMGQKEKAEEYIKSFKDWADNDRSVYKHAALASYYAYYQDTAKTMEHLKLFAKEDNYQYWVILFFDKDPLLDFMQDLPEFKKVVKDIKTKFSNNHNTIKVMLEEKGLL
ncbi:MAG: helix-turn-helix domain-containing protein [Cyclobacteriaceae bacterium]|nr:helix-turn-helix domain-containing protein [Cyclobacteriaceae bacterium]